MFSAMTAMVSPSHQAITRRPLYEQVAPLTFRSGIGSLAMRLMRAVWRWHRRHSERRALRQLDERLLRDIAIERSDALKEWRKPFWRR
jgi:uncharacterized protein YjiS (DUF1127 family)